MKHEIEHGIDMQMAKRLMGHSDIRITDHIYTIFGKKQHENAREEIQNIFKQKKQKRRLTKENQ